MLTIASAFSLFFILLIPLQSTLKDFEQYGRVFPRIEDDNSFV